MIYFNPLRRKIGLLTLVMACMFICVWGRSQIAETRLFLWRSQKTHIRHELSLREWGIVVEQWVRNMPTGCDNQVGERGLPHFSIIPPLTLLSAWLLLSKPRVNSAPTQI